MHQFALRLTADKREIRDFPKLLSATSFIRKPLCVITEIVYEKIGFLKKIA